MRVELTAVAVTCPTETSFRGHLTELAFRRHLAHIRSTDEPEGTETRSSSTLNGTDTPPAPFRFANHVAITLRTPSLCYRSYVFFAVALAAPPGPPAFLSDPVLGKPSKHSAGPPQADPAIAYLGLLGHWFVLGSVPALLQWAWRACRIGRRGKARKKASALDRPGVMEMRAVLPKDEAPTRPSSLVPKLLFKTDSHKDLSELLPLHNTTSGSASNAPGSRRGSIVNLAPPPPAPPTSEPPSVEISSPVLTALKTELAAAQSVLSELQSQLESHDESVAASKSHLQSTLDELRTRRKEDDSERQDLKSKTKTLEDQKRQAESARREAEKRLKAAESIRDGLLAKVAAARGDIEDMKGNMELSKSNVKMVKEEGARHVVETREAVENKTKELGEVEAEVVELDSTLDALGQQVRDAEGKLKLAEQAAEESRKIAPEEEMMLMAAAYEAAASESYNHGHRQNQVDNQWASQAAAYMAEAGFPHLDNSYTGRPAHNSTSFGHSNQYNRPHLTSSTFTPVGDQRPQVHGFEDFGPGVGNRSLATGSSTPPIEVGPRTEDTGSPLGPMPASFPDSWLPQGLVRSLEGDITPLEGAGSEVDVDEDDKFQSPSENRASPDSPRSTESGEDSPRWASEGHDSAFYHRRVTPTSRFQTNATSPNPAGSAATLPGMGGLANSRRWFSTSPSSENVGSSFMFNSGVPGVGSSDSLPGFDSAFAPSASEKRALKWPLLGKSRWTGNGRSISGLDEIAANLKNGDASPMSLGGAAFGLSPPTNGGLSAEELFNRAAERDSFDAPQPIGSSFGSTWRPFKSSPSHSPEANTHEIHDDDRLDGHGPPERKPSFRFFSLRKGAQ